MIMIFFNNFFFSKHPSFPQNNYIILLITIGCELGAGGGGVETHSIKIFFESLNIFHENGFFNKNFKIILVSSPYYHNFIIHHY